jgi:hypothetical protein
VDLLISSVWQGQLAQLLARHYTIVIVVPDA